jgi:hypothetical protein
MASKQRINELNQDERFCHPKDEAQRNFIRDEKTLYLRNRNRFLLYFQDKWNWYDWSTIILLLAVIFTHVADVVSHTELIAKAHIRIFSVTIVFLAIRVFETGRVINEVNIVIHFLLVKKFSKLSPFLLIKKFGMLVVTLSYTIEKIIVWLIIYFILLLPFSEQILYY